MFNFNEAIALSLRTWYPVDHELHSNPHHPLGKMLGKWGKLLDNYMNSVYKPSYVFEPEDELGDIWYYLRILCHQCNNYTPFYGAVLKSDDIDFLISCAIQEASEVFNAHCRSSHGSMLFMLDICYGVILRICSLHNINIEQLTQSNWEKLKPGSERGDEWARARVSTDYIGGKVTKE